MTDQERRIILQARKQSKRPWHSPPHVETRENTFYIISAACFEHKALIGKNNERMLKIQKYLLTLCENLNIHIYAWCVLPNHYHILVKTEIISGLVKELGKMHGRTLREWNIADNSVGRQVWCNCAERMIRSERHFWVSVNYIHNNPVKHGYAEKWTDWKYSSAERYLEEIGREKALEIWREYPVLNYGDKWDFEEAG